MKEYTIERTTGDVPLDGAVEDTPWHNANRLAADQFNWHDSGPKRLTTARLLYDSDTLYLQYHVEDKQITSSVTELNGPTFQDSSVELFADPAPDSDDDHTRYFNFEANCCSFFKLAWQEDGWQEREIGRELLPRHLADRIRIVSSVEGPTRTARPDDEGWWLTAEIPFSVLASFTGLNVAPTSGTVWRGNVYRSGVARDAMKATWNPMPTPEPDYHSPEYFGRIRFA